jgi:hypothetical protein
VPTKVLRDLHTHQANRCPREGISHAPIRLGRRFPIEQV